MDSREIRNHIPLAWRLFAGLFPHDLPLLLLLLSWGAHGYAARLDFTPFRSHGEGARSYPPTAGFFFKTPSTSWHFWLSLFLKNTPCSRHHHRRVPTMSALHSSLLRKRWVAVTPHQTPCPQPCSRRWTLAVAVLPSFRRNITLPACSHAFAIGEFRRWRHSIPPCYASGGLR